MSLLMNATKSNPPETLLSNLELLKTFTRTFTDYWLSHNFDVVISPAGCLPALPHKISSELFFLNAHYMLYNILDYPAGVVPVKLVQGEELKKGYME